MQSIRQPDSAPTSAAQIAATPRQVRDFILLVIGATAIGNSSVLVRIAEVDPAATAFWRMVFAIPVLAIWAMLESRNQTETPSPADRWGMVWPAVAAGFFFCGDMVLSNIALSLTTMTSFIILVHLAPVFVVVVAWFWFRERPSPAVFLALAMAIVGAALLVQSGRASAAPRNALLGDIASVAAAVGYAGFILALRRARFFGKTGIVSLVSSTSCALFCLLTSVALGENLWPASGKAWLALAVMGVVCHAFGQGLSALAVGSLGASVTSVVLVYGVAVTVAGGWLVFGEVPNLMQLTGGMLVLAAVILCRPK
ncbi:MAG: DMT family transporter [Beijerinckiaceae bacterium]